MAELGARLLAVGDERVGGFGGGDVVVDLDLDVGEAVLGRASRRAASASAA